MGIVEGGGPHSEGVITHKTNRQLSSSGMITH